MVYPYAQLRKMGLNSIQIGRIRHHLEAMSLASGPQFVVNRLKAIKQWYLTRLGGGDSVLPGVALRHNRLKGPLSYIFQLKKPRKVIDTLTLIYTSYKSETVTLTQWNKFYNSVVREEGPDLFIPFLENATKEIHQVEYPRCTYRSYPFTGNKRVPSVPGKTDWNTIERLLDDFRTTGVWDTLDHCGPEWVISDVLDDLYPGLLEVREESDDESVGLIGVIQERGLKARFIANPRLVYQLGLRPLGMYLFKLLRGCPWDCTYNQQLGVIWAQKQLQNGKRLWSVDVSDASNNIPFRSTIRVLKWLNCPIQDIELLELVARGRWTIPDYLRKQVQAAQAVKRHSDTQKVPKYITWGQGQPLGIYPSFPAFALWHGCVLRSLELRYQINDTFRVLGDDVIISNPLIYWGYRKLMDKLTVPISETKTLSGIKAGEFAGKIITRKSTFLARKFIIPTSDNECFRIVNSLDGDPTKIATEEQLVCFSAHAGHMDENPCGLSLDERAKYNLLVRAEDSYTVRIPKRSKRLYNELFSHVERKLKQDPEVLSREELDQQFLDEEKDLRSLFPQGNAMNVLAHVVRNTGLYETVVPRELVKEFRQVLTKVSIESREADYSPLVQFGDLLKKHLGPTKSVLGKLRRKVYRSQLGIMKKSKVIVQQELAQVFLALLEEEEPPMTDVIIL